MFCFFRGLSCYSPREGQDHKIVFSDVVCQKKELRVERGCGTRFACRESRCVCVLLVFLIGPGKFLSFPPSR